MSVPASLARGLLAGPAGTATMTVAQTAYYKATGEESSSAPAEVGKRIIGGVLQRDVPEGSEGALNTGMHALYGVTAATAYKALAQS
jgi:hypothetical protein